MTQLRHTEVDGVSCYWVDTGRPTLAASLRFRAGMVDEAAHTAGWLHLLEHMALHGRGGGALSINGSVSLLETTFDAHGPADLVAQHLGATAMWLGAPELADLDRERSVLRAEGRSRGGMAADALLWRYGARGAGLCALDELALGRADPELLTDLARRVFTRSNAVLALDGPPPADLRLTLPDGIGALPVPRAEVVEQEIPGAYVDARGVIVSGVTTRSPGATLLPHLLQEELRDHLRNDAGATYAPWSSYEAVDQHSAVVLAGADVDIAAHPEAAAKVFEIVTRLANAGPTQEALQGVIDQYVQAHVDPYNAALYAWRAASRTLMGFEAETPEDVVAQARALTTEEIRADAVRFKHTLLMGRPEEAAPVHILPVLERPNARPESGREFRSINAPGDRSRLTLSPRGVQVRNGDHCWGVSTDDVVGCLAFPDGKRVFVGKDGWNLPIDPSDWTDGAEAVRLIDERLPAGLLLPQVGQDWGPPTRRLSIWRRWWPAFVHVLGAREGMVFGGLVVTLAGVAILVAGIILEAHVATIIGVIWVVRGIYGALKEDAGVDKQLPENLRDNTPIRPPI